MGGTTWHWAGCAWRYLPSDFELKTRYGQGRDWALTYDDLEPFYYQAEVMMGVCGPDPAVEDLGSPASSLILWMHCPFPTLRSSSAS